MPGPAAIETTPADVTPAKATTMRRLGFGLVSLGVQSYQDRFLRHIGRPYDGVAAGRACSILKNTGFQTLNIDLMFALPGQSTADLRRDLLEAIRHEPDQIRMAAGIEDENAVVAVRDFGGLPAVLWSDQQLPGSASSHSGGRDAHTP